MRLVVTNQRNYLKKKYTMANAWKVARVFLRVLKVIGIFILILTGLLILPLLIGFIADLAVTPQWLNAQKESVVYFSQLHKQQYISIPLSFVNRNEDAWPFYDRAIKLVSDLPSKDRNAIWTLYRGHDYFDRVVPFQIKEAEQLAHTYSNAMALWDTATSCKYCTIPLNYDNGPLMEWPNHIALLRLAELAVIKAQLELAKGHSHSGAQIYCKVLMTCPHSMYHSACY